MSPQAMKRPGGSLNAELSERSQAGKAPELQLQEEAQWLLAVQGAGRRQGQTKFPETSVGYLSSGDTSSRGGRSS